MLLSDSLISFKFGDRERSNGVDILMLTPFSGGEALAEEVLAFYRKLGGG